MKKVRSAALAVAMVLTGGIFFASPAGAATYSSTVTASIPEYSASNQVATITGKVTPCPSSGRPVSINIVDSSGLNPTWKAGTTTNADCTYAVSFPTDYVRYYRVYAGPKTVGSDTYNGANSSNFSQIKSLRLWDTFQYADRAAMQNSGKWTMRQPNYATCKLAEDPNCVDVSGSSGRYHNSSSWDSLDVITGQGYDNSAIRLNIVPDGTSTKTNKPRFKSPQLSAGFFPAYGTMEARIKFGKPKGAHGALWWQSGYDESQGQGEIDIAEFFGQETSGNGSSFVQSSLHTRPTGSSSYNTRCFRSWTGAYQTLGDGTKCGVPANTPAARQNFGTNAWWSDYHTFAATWTASGITFKIDGVNVGTITSYSPSASPEAILSLLVSDDLSDGTPYEHSALLNHINSGKDLNDYDMYVDWVRIYR